MDRPLTGVEPDESGDFEVAICALHSQDADAPLVDDVPEHLLGGVSQGGHRRRVPFERIADLHAPGSSACPGLNVRAQESPEVDGAGGQTLDVADAPSRSLALVVALTLATGGLVVSAVSGTLGTVAAALIGSGMNPEGTVPALVGVLLVTSEAGFVLIGYAFRQTDDGAGLIIDWRGCPTLGDAALVAGATAGLVAFNRVAFGLGELVGIDPVTAVSAPEELSVAVFAFMMPAMLLVVGPAEEYLFRGVLQGYLRRSFSTRGAIGWSAVLFMLIHLPNLVSNPESGAVSVPVWLGIGLGLGWLYERTGALLVPILVHGFYNVAVLALLFAELGIV